jgi:hypothetical protein
VSYNGGTERGPKAQPFARARWRRCFALSLAFRLFARIALLDFVVFFTGGSDLDGIGDLCSSHLPRSRFHPAPAQPGVLLARSAIRSGFPVSVFAAKSSGPKMLTGAARN